MQREDVRVPGGDGAIAVYIGALWRNNHNKGEERARRMNASTRLMFTIAGCALGVAAVGGFSIRVGIATAVPFIATGIGGSNAGFCQVASLLVC